jgi:hypothetical protein
VLRSSTLNIVDAEPLPHFPPVLTTQTQPVAFFVTALSPRRLEEVLGGEMDFGLCRVISIHASRDLILRTSGAQYTACPSQILPVYNSQLGEVACRMQPRFMGPGA